MSSKSSSGRTSEQRMTGRGLTASVIACMVACSTSTPSDTHRNPGGNGGSSGAAGGTGAGSGGTTAGAGSPSGAAGTTPSGASGTGTMTGGVSGSGGAVATGGASGSGAGAGGAAGSSAGTGQAGTGQAGTGQAGTGQAGTGQAGAAGTGGQTAPVNQTTPGTRAALPVQESFDGIAGPNGNPSDPSIAVGPNHIVQTVNWSMAVFTKRGSMYTTTGMSLRGPVASSSVFAGFGGPCETSSAIDHGDVVVRYDQLAGRWLFVMPVLRSPYTMCYAVSTGADPLGTYNRYAFTRQVFPDYPRPGIWPDGYYVASSVGDDVVRKQVCVAERAKMIAGQPATEQCVSKDGVGFLNPSDVEGMTAPPSGAPNVLLALGGTQLQNVFEDDGVYAYKLHVDWTTPANTSLTGPTKIPVARYHYLCDGQLTSCVPQSNTTRRLDAQGDKLMQRLSYRNFGTHQSLVVTHSINGPNGGGGLRWYEFRLDASGNPFLVQQSTYAPDVQYRWLGSAAIDRFGNIGIGYSFGGSQTFPGQRFAARAAADPLGVLSFQETVLIQGQASQTDTLRWEDYTTVAIDPSDDATFWYVGDYLKTGGARATRIGSFRVP